MYGFFRSTLDESLVRPFEVYCAQVASSRTRKPVASAFSRQVRTRLVDEALCWRGYASAPRGQSRVGVMPTIDASEVLNVVGCIALAEINYRLGRSAPLVIDDVAYPRDPSGAAIELLVVWGNIAGLTDARLMGEFAVEHFAQPWRACIESVFNGALIGLGRVTKEVLFARARADCRSFSSGGRVVVEQLLQRARRAD